MPKVFAGYQGLMSDFWGFSPEEIASFKVPEATQKHPMWVRPVVMLAEDVRIDQFPEFHASWKTAPIDGVGDYNGVPFIRLVADGGFYSALFLEDNVPPEFAEKLFMESTKEPLVDRLTKMCEAERPPQTGVILSVTQVSPVKKVVVYATKETDLHGRALSTYMVRALVVSNGKDGDSLIAAQGVTADFVGQGLETFTYVNPWGADEIVAGTVK